MTKIHVAALRTYLSSIDLLMSYTLLVNWNLPKHPAESAPTAATSTNAIPFPNRLHLMAVPLPGSYRIITECPIVVPCETATQSPSPPTQVTEGSSRLSVRQEKVTVRRKCFRGTFLAVGG